MSKTNYLLLFLVFVLAVGCSFTGQNPSITDKAATDNAISDNTITGNALSTEIANYEEPAALPLPAVENLSRWSKPTHHTVAEVCAAQWGLSVNRQATLGQASEMPDVYQSGIDNDFNQQWSHAYLYTILGIQIWGDADDDFYDNLNGDSGESESPEGYNGKWAGYYYNAGNQNSGDWYLGYALHFIEDVGFVLHSSLPSINMLVYHFDFESWINNNLTSGHNFLADIQADHNYYAVTDPKAAIRSCAYGCSYSNSSLGKNTWDAYTDSGFPVAAGSGSSALVSNMRQMIVRMARYAKGAIKYTLDRYNQWSAAY